MPIVTDHTALLTGSYWSGIEVTNRPALITYSFATSAPATDEGVIGSPAFATFQAFTSAQKTQIRAALAEWGDASGLTFIEVPAGASEITFSAYDFTGSPYDSSGGVGFYPFGNWNFFSFPNYLDGWNGAGNVLLNSDFLTAGQFDYGLILHEIGHALGLKHPTETWTSAAGVLHDQVLAVDDPSLTIMSQLGGPLVHLAALDIAAIQNIYGLNSADLTNWSYDSLNNILTQTTGAGGVTLRGTNIRDVLNGGTGNDVLTGLFGDDSIFGNNGNDLMFGGSGNDLLNGGVGTDTMHGGFGDDKYVINTMLDQVVEFAGEGIDTITSSVTYTLPAEVEKLTLSGVAAINATGNSLNNTINGNNVANTLTGNDGNDTLDGKLGNDVLIGGLGNDTYVLDSSGDQVTELAGGGTDTIKVGFTFDLAPIANVEKLTFTGTLAINGSGNALANTLTGNVAANTLNGGNGADKLLGMAGDDNLNGGLGADTLTGGLGRDTLSGGSADADTFVYTTIADSGTGVANRDVVTDFDAADRINLSSIDTNPGLSGDQAFVFAGSGPITGDWQVSYQINGADTLVSINTTGTVAAEMEVLLVGYSAGLTSLDFVL
ncbi:hypothetical protein [Nitrosomonas sp.]|uniref:hypothetical protein n=1 Tax=Nitrosomonas sp. TaxID=42353 RepID=UPI002603B9CC|nr:hypothetical protein [Nitrosomonas sp.]